MVGTNPGLGPEPGTSACESQVLFLAISVWNPLSFASWVGIGTAGSGEGALVLEPASLSHQPGRVNDHPMIAWDAHTQERERHEHGEPNRLKLEA